MKRLISANTLFTVALLSCTLFTGPQADGSTIVVLNPSFEAPSLALGQYTNDGTIPGWVLSIGSAGVLRPTANQYNGGNAVGGSPSDPAVGIPDGSNVGWSNGGTISQMLTEVLSPGTYTLLVDIGHRLDTAFPGYAIQLLAGGTLLAQDDSTLSLDPGTFATSTVTYTASAGDPLLGQSLEIRLISSDVQMNYDNVRLSVGTSAVPEPSSVFMLGLGAFGLIGVTIRRRRAA